MPRDPWVIRGGCDVFDRETDEYLGAVVQEGSGFWRGFPWRAAEFLMPTRREAAGRVYREAERDA